MSSLTAPTDDLLVRMPLGGPFRLLRWWTDEKRGHIVLARSKRSILKVAARVFEEDPDAQITYYAAVEIVAPSPHMQKLAREGNRRSRIFKFHREIVSAVQAVAKAGRGIPGPFRLCTKYEPEDNGPPDGWARDSHYNCRHCIDTIRLVGMTPDDLYETYYDAWYVAQPAGRPWRHVERREGLHPSRAEVARDGEPLRYASADFGPHAQGIRLQEINDTDEAVLDVDVLFFYRHVVNLNADALIAMGEKALAAATKAQDQRAKARLAERQREDQKRIDATIAFFTPGAP